MSEHARPYFEIANPEIPVILDSLPKGLSVLDVGCGSGVHGAELKRAHGHRVVGVDLSEGSIEKAKTRLAEAYVSDVTRPDLYPFAGRRRFDVIVFSDILEHLPYPGETLEGHVRLLAPGGSILISMPNVAIWNVRLALLCGSFRYTETGTLDRTHLRFFTRRTILELISGAGLRITRTRITPGLLRPFVPLIKRLYGATDRLDGATDSSSIMESRPYQFYTRWFYPFESILCRMWPSLLAFQFVTLSQAVAETVPVEGISTEDKLEACPAGSVRA